MPTVFRSMKAGDDGLPIVGDRSRELGVRVPPNPHADIDVDSNTNLVVLNGNGMSVVENWRDLSDHLIPARLSTIVPQAVGSNDLKCFRLGDGPFVAGLLAAGLELVLKPGSSRHGNLTPTTAVTVAQFQALLAATRADWVEDET
jgi:hypothetical protein